MVCPTLSKTQLARNAHCRRCRQIIWHTEALKKSLLSIAFRFCAVLSPFVLCLRGNRRLRQSTIVNQAIVAQKVGLGSIGCRPSGLGSWSLRKHGGTDGGTRRHAAPPLDALLKEVRDATASAGAHVTARPSFESAARAFSAKFFVSRNNTWNLKEDRNRYSIFA